MGERRAATAGLPWAAWASAMARSFWSWVAGPVAALTGALDRRAAWPPRVRWPGRLTLAVARRAAWTACRRPGPGARRRIEVAVAWRRARELGRLRRASAAAGDAGQMPSLPGPGVALVRRWCAHRVPADARGPGPGGMRYRARHLTIARCRPRWRPATGGRRDAIPVARLPAPGPPGRGVVRVAVTCAFTAMARSGCRPGTGGLRGTGRGTGCDRARMARPGWGQSGIVSCLGVPRPWTGCSQTHQSRCAVHRGRARNLVTKGH